MDEYSSARFAQCARAGSLRRVRRAGFGGAVAWSEENIETLGAKDLVTVHRTSALGFANGLGSLDYDVAFADPPYAGGEAIKLAERWLRTPFSRVLSVEHSATSAMPEGGTTRKYGSTAITFYRSEE